MPREHDGQHEEEGITRDQIIRLEALRVANSRTAPDATTAELVQAANKIHGFLTGAPAFPPEQPGTDE